MKKKVFAIMFLIGCISFSNAQPSLNDYKYIIVPNKYDFLNEADKFQLNSLTKFLFNKYGFTAIMEDESSTRELLSKPCLALRSNLFNNSGLFKTKLVVELRNCMNEVVFSTREGETREKDFAKAYNFALRDAFKSFERVDYAYQPKEEEVVSENDTKTSEQKEVEKLEEEIKVLKEEKELRAKEEVVAVVATEVAVKEEVAAVKEEVAPVVEEKVSVKEEVVALPVMIEQPDSQPVEEASTKLQETEKSVDKPDVSEVLYAQPIDNGFQLVDSGPKVVYKIKRSGTPDMYFVEGKQAIVYKSGSDWILEFYENNILIKKVLKIKF